jgi:hypothetical protein
MRSEQMTPKLFAPTVNVIMDDGTEHRVQAVNQDMIKWDMTRHAKRWPPTDECSSKWVTFLAWAAMRRQGIISMTLEDFETKCLSVEPLESGGKDLVDPTPEVAGGGS